MSDGLLDILVKHQRTYFSICSCGTRYVRYHYRDTTKKASGGKYRRCRLCKNWFYKYHIYPYCVPDVNLHNVRICSDCEKVIRDKKYAKIKGCEYEQV